METVQCDEWTNAKFYNLQKLAILTLLFDYSKIDWLI
jgi:hypothetical protein